MDLYLVRRETRLEYDSPGEDHTLGGLRIRSWGIIFVFLGFLRVAATA
jgi:hypothetical protein